MNTKPVKLTGRAAAYGRDTRPDADGNPRAGKCVDVLPDIGAGSIPDRAPLTLHRCGPTLTCPDGGEHDYSEWIDYKDSTGCGAGTAVCSKCGHRAIDDAFWD